jgi:hypothetical protein
MCPTLRSHERPLKAAAFSQISLRPSRFQFLQDGLGFIERERHGTLASDPATGRVNISVDQPAFPDLQIDAAESARRGRLSHLL